MIKILSRTLCYKGKFKLECHISFLKRNSIIQQDEFNFSTEQTYFKKCFHDYFEGLHRYAFSILKNNEEANDIVQFAFMKLWEKRNLLHARQASQYYLYKIVYNQCLNNIRNKKLQQEKNKYYAQQFNETAMQIIDKDVTSRVNAAIHKLPSKCREVFMKSRFEGKKYADIAAELKISLKTVEAQMTKALKNLRVSLSDLLDK